MKVMLPVSYPAENPVVSFEKVKGLTDAELEELKKSVKVKIDTELSGQNREMIFDLTQLVEEFLQQHNLPPQSLHDQMVARQKALERETRERMLTKQKMEREETASFESNYARNRIQTLMGDAENAEDVFTLMGKEVSRAMSYRPSSTTTKAAKATGSPTGERRGQVASPIPTSHLLDARSDSSEDSFDENAGYSSEDPSDEEDEDEDFGFDSSKLISPPTRKELDLRKATRSFGRGALEEKAKKPTKAQQKAATKNEKDRRENTFFQKPLGLGWDHDDDADSDEYEDADKTKAPEFENPRPIARVQKSLVRWIHPKELAPSKTCKLFKANDTSNEKPIVVKEYALPMLDRPKTDMLESLCETIFRASRSLSHEHLTRYLGADYKPQSNHLYLLRDFCAGDVSTVLRARHLDEPKVRSYLLQIVSCVSYLHGLGIFGLNIKANNLLLDNQGRLKLADYIGAHQISALVNPEWKPNDEANWWSPEVKQQERTEREQDLIDIGMTMLELATGSRTRGSLPSNFTSHALNFYTSCMTINGQTITDLKCHPFIAFDFDENTQGDFVPLSPASSAPGFHHFMRRGERSGGIGTVTFGGSDNSTTWGTSSSPSQATNTTGLTGSMNSSSTGVPIRSSNQDKAPSRYRIDFEELQVLGKGGFGQVVKARNRLDDNLYAIKKIRFGRTDANFVERLKREVMTLSRLNHPHVVRYFNAWIGDAEDEDFGPGSDDEEFDEEDEEFSEDDDDEEDESRAYKHSSDEEEVDSEESQSDGETPSIVMEEDQDLFDQSLGGRTFDETISFDDDRLAALGNALTTSRTARLKRGKEEPKKPKGQQAKPPSKVLYIQMEYCTEKTLKNMIDERSLSEENKWRLFRQVVEGLHHIHSQGIIHRDLKPTNVFIDSSGDIKIGDFGLAVTSAASDTKAPINLNLSRPATSKNAQAEGLTTGVGTPLYLAPEQDRAGASYNQKVDVYSLGVIFFELFMSFSTAMERYTVIRDLRTKEIKLPPAWVKDPIKTKLVKWMLSHDPEDRPSTLTLLQSELLPVRLEDEVLKEAMRSITIPNTTMHSLLLKRLFGVPGDPTTDLSFDLDAPQKTPYESVLQATTARRLIKIFEVHAASFIEPPVFFPRPSLYLPPRAVQFLTPTGTVISLPFDLTMPFARFVAQKNIRFLRRYVFGKVYRATSGHPREMRECDFDIVGASSNRLAMTAEVIQVLVELLQEFRDELGRSVVRFTNFKVLDAIIGRISDSIDVQRKIRGVLSQFWRKQSPRETEKMLLNIEGVTSKALDSVKMEQLLQFSKDLTCPAMDTLTKIENLYPKDRIVQEMLRETKAFVAYAELFQIVSHMRFDITLIYNYEYYYDIMFQGFLLSGDAIAAGGCYDTVVDHFAMQFEPSVAWAGDVAGEGAAAFGRGRGGGNGGAGREGGGGNHRSAHRSAVGMNIAMDNLVNRIVEHQRVLDEQMLDWVGATRLLVYSHLRPNPSHSMVEDALEQRLQVAQLLWRNKIPADYQYDESQTFEQLVRECELKGTQWIVILKDGRAAPGAVNGVLEKKTMLRVKDIRTKNEVAITLGNLATYFSSRALTLSDATESYFGAPHLHTASTGNGHHHGHHGTSAASMGSTATNAASSNASETQKPLSRVSMDLPSDSEQTVRTAEVECLDVEIVGPLRQEKGAKGKKDIVRAASERVAHVLKNLAPKSIIKIAAIDIPLQSIRDVLIVLEAGGDVGPLERRLGKVKDRVPYLKDYWVKVRRDKHPYAFFYSIIDDDFQMSFMKR